MPPIQRTQNRTFYLLVVKDLVALGLLATILGIIHFTFKPFERGFYCTDETIRYPHKESTISSALLYISGTLTNLFLILFFEYYNLAKIYKSDEFRSRDDFIKNYMGNVYCRLIVWGFGALSSELLTDIAKVSAGRLRPHFIDICRPDIHEEDSNSNSNDLVRYCASTADKYKYITKYSCTGVEKKPRDARMSFMSGHSSYAAYSAGHAALYLQTAMDSNDFGLIRCFLQVVLISMAFYTGLSRISDYKHHWQDVLCGLTQGTLVAIIVTKCLWPSFYKTFCANARLKQNSADDENRQAGQELNRVRY